MHPMKKKFAPTILRRSGHTLAVGMVRRATPCRLRQVVHLRFEVVHFDSEVVHLPQFSTP